MLNGWIKIHRKMFEWEWYSDTNTKAVFLHLLLLANHEPRRWRGRTIETGQIVASTRDLSEKLKLGRQSVRTSLERLKSTHEITQSATHRFSIVTVNKWSDYQSSNPLANQQLTHCQPTANPPSHKKGKNYKNLRTTSKEVEGAPAPSTSLDSMNQEIDRSFPRKRLYGDETLNWLLDFFEFRFDRPSLDGGEKWSRIFARHLKTKIGARKAREMIEWASDPECWWYSKLTGLKMLYYKREQIIAAMQSAVSEVEKNKKPYIDGDRAYQNKRGDWKIIPRDGGTHLNFVGDVKDIVWK